MFCSLQQGAMQSIVVRLTMFAFFAYILVIISFVFLRMTASLDLNLDT